MSELLHSGFLESVKKSPHAIAVKDMDHCYTYQQLYEKAVSIAFELVELGVGRNDRVVVYCPKGFSSYSAILGVLLTNAAYVPIEPSYPQNRIQKILVDCQPKVCLVRDTSDIADMEDVSTEQPIVLPIVEINSKPTILPNVLNTPQDLAYIIYTSGSTGDPKGVMITHENVCAFIDWAYTRFGINSTDRVSNHSDLPFDLSVFEIFIAWRAGACLVPVTDRIEKTLPVGFIKRNEITVWISVPSVLAAISLAKKIDDTAFSSLRMMLFCGEPLPPNPVRETLTKYPDLRIENLYGPTETAVACSAYTIRDIPRIGTKYLPVGWRSATTEIFLWTEHGDVAEIGEEGEIHITGSQVGPGYWRNQDETEKRYIKDPRFPEINSRCYKTGDIGRATINGPEFIGRADQQVKYRGWRIELGEIESVLNSLDSVTDAACLLLGNSQSKHELVAVVRSAQVISPAEILEKLELHLPSYMIPNRVAILNRMPTTLSGKIDRKALAKQLTNES